MFDGLSYSQPRNLYVKKPVQDFVAAGSMLNKQYDENAAAMNKFDMALASIPARDELKGQLNQELGQYNKVLKEYATNNNYEDAGAAVNKLATDFVRNPLIKGIQEDYQNYNNYVSTYQKEVNDGKVNRDDFEKSLMLHKATYNKPLEIDPLTGMVKNKFQGNTIPQNIEIDKNIAALIKDLEADKIPSDLAQRLPGYTGLATTKGLSPERVAKIARDYVTSDESVKDLLAFRADTDTKLARLQTNGSLRPYTRADLENLGLDNTIIEKTYNPDGTLNQNIADNLVKAVHMDNEVKKHENLAKNFAYSEYNADYKENWIQKQQNEFQHDKDMEKLKQQYKLDDEQAASIYSSIFTTLPGTKTSVDTKLAQNLVDNVNGNPVSQADFNNLLSPETVKALGNKEFSTTEMAILKDLHDIRANVKRQWKTVADMPDEKPFGELAKAVPQLRELIRLNPTKYGKFNLDTSVGVRKALKEIEGIKFSELSKESLKEVEDVTNVVKDLSKLGSKKFKISNYSGENNLERTKQGGRLLLDSEIELDEADYEQLDSDTRDLLDKKGLLRTEPSIKNGKTVNTYYIKSKFDLQPSAGSHALFDKAVGINNKEKNYLREQQEISNFTQSSREQSIKQANEIAPLVQSKGLDYNTVKVPGYSNLNEALLTIQANAHLWTPEQIDRQYEIIKKAINGN